MQAKIPHPGLFGLGLVSLVGMLFLLTACGAGELPPTDYAVQPGENLAKIARDHNTTVPELAQSNNLPAEDELQPTDGTVLKIPPPAIPPYPDPGSLDQTYEVQSGDTLDSIAAQYKNLEVTVDKLVAANNLPNRSRIRVGQLLKIPGPKIVPPPVCAHFFHAGERIDRIAAYYGVDQKQVMAENNLPTASALIPGDKLNITMPTSEKERKFKLEKDCPDPNLSIQIILQGGPVPAPSIESPSDWNGPTEEYIVKSGDTLFAIAASHNTTVAILAKDNHITNPRLIRPGQKLLIRKNT